MNEQFIQEMKELLQKYHAELYIIDNYDGDDQYIGCEEKCSIATLAGTQTYDWSDFLE